MQQIASRGVLAQRRLIAQSTRRTYTQSSRRRGTTQGQSPQSPAKDSSPINRIESRLPRFLHRFTKPLRDAPVSHITAFLILHEITAVLPLFGLAGFFHYSGWMPPYISEGAWVREGTERFGKWLRKQGWIDAKDDLKSKWYGRGEGSIRLVAEFATAYAITKALLPLRLPFSVFLTPWFARWTTLPATGVLKRFFRRRSAKKAAAASSSSSPSTTTTTATGTTAGVPTQGVTKAGSGSVLPPK